MNRLKNGTRTVGICLLFLMMMFTPGCLENQTASSATGPSGPCDLFETTPSNTSGSVTGVGTNETSEEERINTLVQRRQKLLNQKAIAGDRLETARSSLERAKEEAREKYGTDDPDELARLLESSRAENETKISKFAEDLQKVEDKLASIDDESNAVIEDE